MDHTAEWERLDHTGGRLGPYSGTAWTTPREGLDYTAEWEGLDHTAEWEGLDHTAELYAFYGCVSESVAVIAGPRPQVLHFPDLVNTGTIVACCPVSLQANGPS